MNSFFQQLFDYNFFCNKSLIEKFNTLDHIPENTAVLFSHILNAHHIWNMRLLEKESQYNVWQPHQQEEWNDIHYDNQRTTFEIVQRTDNFNKRIDYKNSEDRLFTNSVQEILFHIINHSTHERGKIAADLRSNDIEPLPLDYIFYKR